MGSEGGTGKRDLLTRPVDVQRLGFTIYIVYPLTAVISETLWYTLVDVMDYRDCSPPESQLRQQKC